jgi:hypothetical protein
MENHQHHSIHPAAAKNETKKEIHKMDHSKMDHGSMHHDGNPHMGKAMTIMR